MKRQYRLARKIQKEMEKAEAAEGRVAYDKFRSCAQIDPGHGASTRSQSPKLARSLPMPCATLLPSKKPVALRCELTRLIFQRSRQERARYLESRAAKRMP